MAFCHFYNILDFLLGWVRDYPTAFGIFMILWTLCYGSLEVRRLCICIGLSCLICMVQFCKCCLHVLTCWDWSAWVDWHPAVSRGHGWTLTWTTDGINPFRPAPDSTRVGHRSSFHHQTGFRSCKTMHTNERRRQRHPCLFLIMCKYFWWLYLM